MYLDPNQPNASYEYSGARELLEDDSVELKTPAEQMKRLDG